MRISIIGFSSDDGFPSVRGSPDRAEYPDRWRPAHPSEVDRGRGGALAHV